MKIAKKFGALLVCAVVGATATTGCSSAPAPTPEQPKQEETKTETTVTPTEAETPKTDEKKLEGQIVFMTNIIGAQADLLEELSGEFTKETGVKVEFIAPGSTYEEVMKTKMAANDLPDVFTTHGWSVARYSEYLMPVNDQPWANNISPSIKPIITNASGEMFVLPMDVDLAGIVYNKKVLESSGVNVDDIKTWTDFEAAMGKVKGAGYTPIHIGGKDSWTIGQYFDWVAPSLYITAKDHNAGEALKGGTFDWKEWDKINQKLADWCKSGFLNQDALTADYMAGIKGLAEDKVAFEFYGNSAITEAQKMNANVQLGMMSIPAAYDGDAPYLMAGERTAVGVWKDSKNKDAAVAFLDFLARPENVSRVASSNALPAGLKGVESDMGSLAEYYQKYTDVQTVPYFDREYLPSGMWDDFCITGANIIMKGESAISEATKQMEQSFTDKFNQ
ncbi:MAG: ABC transporter substrate-binding protein [Cellulosilyticaceae bacterium]